MGIHPCDDDSGGTWLGGRNEAVVMFIGQHYNDVVMDASIHFYI